ncbi:MAG: AGE family epimerase/isomerase [Pseudomonadota bacterium]
MNFLDHDFLRGHIRSILKFYAPNVVDPEGGFFQNFLSDGRVFDPGRRHLVSSTRMVFNYCKAYELFGQPEDLKRARHGLAFVEQAHWDARRRGYHWTLKDPATPDDQTNHCYGLAFVVLCYASAHEAGIEGAAHALRRAVELMESRFWMSEQGLYADEATPDWSDVAAYRGQNANMHACEAMIAAYEALGESRYLDRACELARKVAVELADQSDGLVWEHFKADLSIDWDYNRDDPKNLYRPWGFQPGHQTEWTKLLLILHGHRPEPWMLERATSLFDRALQVAWDHEHGGVFYGFAPDGGICDRDKYFWVHAETLAASARLLAVTGEAVYRQWYDRIWAYAWEHLVDHNCGAWYRVLDACNTPLSDEKSSAGAKCDYHTIGACWDVLRSTRGLAGA